MTIDISNNNPRISYSVASGVTQTTFAVPFEFFDDSDLNVYVDGVLKTITSDYTLTGGDGSTGTVTMSVTGAVNGSTVQLTRDTTIERVTDFTAGVDINRAALNTQLDTLTAISADVKDLAERAIRVDDLEVAPNLVLPSIADRAGKLMAFDTEGGVSVASDEALGNIVIGANYITDSFTGDGSTTAFTLSVAANSKNNTQVHVDGVYQNKATYSLYASTLTFSEAPPLNASIEVVSGDSISEGLTANASAIGYNQGGTDTTVQLALDSLRSEEKYPPIFAYQSAVSDSTLLEVVPEAGAYNAFPNLTRVKNNRLVGVYWHGNGHSPTIAGDDLGEFRVIYSDDNGATWSTPVALIGNITAGSSGFAYYKALGTDSSGRAVLVGTIKISGSGNQTGIMRSEDGVTWSTWTPISISGVGIPAFPLPFGQIKTTPSGTLCVPFYTVGEGRWVGRINDKNSETSAALGQIVDATVLGGGNEFAICIVSELEQYAFLRQSNLTNQVPIYRSTDAGVTWSAFSDMNIATSGGWLPQDTQLTSISGKLYVAVLLGARKTISLPAPDSPSAALFMAPLEEARVAGEFTFDRVHYWPLADDGEPRDGYIGSVYDKSSNSLAILTHSETASDESKILAGAVRIGEVYDGSLDRTSVVRWNSVTYTDNGSSAKFEKIGNQVFGRIVMSFTGLDTTDTSNITLRATSPDFPYTVTEAGECSIDMSASTSGMNFSAGDITKVAFTSSNATVSITDGDAVPYTYDSGKINTSGTAVFYVQYTTG